ncbi:MAG: VWA domain-containing protein [Phycisphaeraceae bacterium]|nr:VWA domain-containing protein [Phycisphaeraceae bacterium]
MSFLAPTSALIAAALVLPALLAMYLLKLRRRPLRVSSIMLWPESASDIQVNVPIAPPKPSWLMLLHLLIACTLIAAVGRPVLLHSGEHAGKVLLIIDRSASMRAMDGASSTGERISRLDEAKHKARGIVNGSAASTQFAVVAASSGAEIIGEFSANPGSIASSIDRVSPTDQPGDLNSAMEVARALLQSVRVSEEIDSGAEVLVFSDGSFEDGSREPPSPGGVVRLVRCGPPPSADKQNLGIVVLSVRRDADHPDVVNIFVKVQNASRSARSVPIRLSIDGAVLETRTVSVSGQTNAGLGETSVVFSASVPAGGIAMVSLLVDEERDLLLSDNAAAINLRNAAPARILLVQRAGGPRMDGEPAAIFSADFLLADALAELSPGELTRVTRDRYEAMAAAGELKFYDIVVFDGVAPSAAPVLPSLSFGAGVPELELGEPAPAKEAHPVQSWSRSSPLLRDITLDGVVVAHERAFRGKGSEVLARSERSPLIILSEPENGPKRILVTFRLEDSNWPLQAGFPIFLKSAVDLLTSKGAENAGVQFLTVQPVFFEGIGNPPRYVGPADVLARIAPGQPVSDSPDAKRRMTLGVLDRAGVYTPESGAGFPPIAVNLLDSHESAVATSDVLRVGSRVLSQTGNISRPREVWWWALVLAAALLAIEWLIFARSARL